MFHRKLTLVTALVTAAGVSASLASGQPTGMALVPGGEFEMGDHHDMMMNAVPPHAVYVDSFFIDVHEATNERYCAYLNSAILQGAIEVNGGVVYATGGAVAYCDTHESSSNSRIHWDGNSFTITTAKEDHPMIRVTWYGAAAYANWRSTEEGRVPCYEVSTWECDFEANGYRLPTEAEWEYATRGGEHDPYYRYPWGDSIDGSNANYYQSGDPFDGELIATTPVGYYDGGQTPPGPDMANGYGLYDVIGNVREWCNDWYDAWYYPSSPYDNPRGPASGMIRVERGGNFGCMDPECLYTAYRMGGGPANPGTTGFRLAMRFEEAAVPAVSEWGTIIMMLLVLTVGTVVIGRRATTRHAAGGV